jgi:hypothetical protein
MDQDIAWCGTYAPNVARFLKAAYQNDRGIRAQMAVPGQAEAGAQGFYSWGDASKVGAIDQNRHVRL